MTTSHELADHDVTGQKISHGPITKAVVDVVMASARWHWLVLGAALLLSVLSGFYVVARFSNVNDPAINPDTDEFIAASVPWRQDEIAYAKAFPDQDNTIIVVVD